MSFKQANKQASKSDWKDKLANLVPTIVWYLSRSINRETGIVGKQAITTAVYVDANGFLVFNADTFLWGQYAIPQVTLLANEAQSLLSGQTVSPTIASRVNFTLRITKATFGTDKFTIRIDREYIPKDTELAVFNPAFLAIDIPKAELTALVNRTTAIGRQATRATKQTATTKTAVDLSEFE